MSIQGNAFNEYGIIYCSLINLGNKSDGDRDVNRNANINKNSIKGCFGFD